MAALTLQVGALSRSRSAPDGKMSAVMALVIEATGGPVNGTNAEKADHVLTMLSRYLLDVANGQKVKVAREAAEAGIAPEDLA